MAEELAKSNEEIAKFIRECQKMTVDEETIAVIEKKGIFTGIYADHPFDKSWRLPVYIANFILADYGTGAIFACPAHDERDYEFAKKYDLPIKKVVECETLPFVGEGAVINSDFLNGLTTAEAKLRAIKELEKLGVGEKRINYRLRDWSFSRQRYWGCPIPVVYCPHCGAVTLDKKDLPLKLPEDAFFDGKGNPLEKHRTWKHTKCPKCGGDAVRETDTMDTFVDSSWYFLRYVELCEDRPINGELCEKILPVDQYVGGVEHATGHLIYARFFTKALRDCGYFKLDEPVKRLLNQGLVCHRAFRGKTSKDWCYPWDVKKVGEKFYNAKTDEELSDEGVIKMSKSKSNVVDVNSVIDTYGTDSARLFILSDTPADKDTEWTEEGIVGCWRYLNRMYRFISNFHKNHGNQPKNVGYVNEIIKFTHAVIKDVTKSLEKMEFNRSIARMRELSNFFEKIDLKFRENVESCGFAIANYLKLLSPFAPHFCGEMLETMGMEDGEKWPKFNEALTVADKICIAIQVNGKLRGTVEVDRDCADAEIEKLAAREKSVAKYLEGNVVKKVFVAPKKLVNFVLQL
jgi:leucyl-tRNA synthetase